MSDDNIKKVDTATWEERMNNLMERRKKPSHHKSPASNYKEYIEKVHVGKTVLDVGCGSMALKKCLPQGMEYYGLDAFPVNDTVIKGKIEDELTVHIFSHTVQIETVCAFAVLDGCQDFDKAIENMQKIARTNIVILTGIGISVDRYHTFKLEVSDFLRLFAGWHCIRAEYVSPKVCLMEFFKL